MKKHYSPDEMLDIEVAFFSKEEKRKKKGSKQEPYQEFFEEYENEFFQRGKK
jgi:hypothetical protein